MDTLRGTFESGEPADRSWDASDEESAEPASRRDLPPDSIGQDERRMQVRAYNHWASLLGERMFPSITDLEPADLPDFGPFSVLLDFSLGIEDPVVRFVGDTLAQECSANGKIITRLSDVPPRSLLSRITDHYMQILANQAPIGFEAEFVNQRGAAILYRGILLPYSSDDQTIDFIFGVINWKEMADQLTADELLLEIDQALELDATLELGEPEPHLQRPAEPVTDWADSPAHETDEPVAEAGDYSPALVDAYAASYDDDFGNVAPLDGTSPLDSADHDELPMPDFGQFALDDDDEEYDEDEGEPENASYNFASLADYIEPPVKKAIDLSEFTLQPEDDDFDPEDYRVEYSDLHAEDNAEDDSDSDSVAGDMDDGVAPIADTPKAIDMGGEIGSEIGGEPPVEPFEEQIVHAIDPVFDAPEMPADEPAIIDELPQNAGLYDCLASARELARTADSTEDRSRSALYAAVSRAYDFSLAAEAAPDDYAELISESGLTVQERAPMTPVVKLVFGHDYDKTRLTEYAAVLSHAHRLQLERGSLATFLTESEGGVKAIVKAERNLRREEQGKPVQDAAAVREALAQQLRALEAIMLEELDGAGSEFALVLIRRDEIGCTEILGEVPEDIALIERAARKLVG